MKYLASKNLLPFRRRHNGFHLAGTVSEEEERIVQKVDPKLNSEDQAYVRHYLSRADTLLQGPADAADHNNVKEFPRISPPEEKKQEPAAKRQEKKAA